LRDRLAPRTLQQYFRNQDPERVIGLAPREGPPILATPSGEIPTERSNVRLRHVTQGSSAGRVRAAHAGTSISLVTSGPRDSSIREKRERGRPSSPPSTQARAGERSPRARGHRDASSATHLGSRG